MNIITDRDLQVGDFTMLALLSEVARELRGVRLIDPASWPLRKWSGAAVRLDWLFVRTPGTRMILRQPMGHNPWDMMAFWT